jgi:hypothetical protein
MIFSTLCLALAVTACGGSNRSAKRQASHDDDEAPSGGQQLTFDQKVAKVRELMPQFDRGTAVVAQFLVEKTQTRTSYFYLDDTSAEYNSTVKSWVMMPKAKADSSLISSMSIIAKRLEAGRYECGADNLDVAIGIQMGSDKWSGKAADTSWTLNTGGACEFELHPAAKAGDLEGTFRGKLPSNDGNTYLLIDEGYIYIRRPPSGAGRPDSKGMGER